ncbi:MAG: N-acetylmuramoyl-L-alanine amidase [Gammaproteobacteria bacterium]|nr:N-acetylmuramoyl-L-alanine amidase [Gammaproteobacteria bacterium]
MSLPPPIVTPRIGLLRRAGLAAVLLSSLVLAPRGLGGEAAELRALRLQQEGAVTRLFVDLSAATGYRFFTLDNPRRAVIDLESARDASRGALPAPTGAVSGLRTGAQPGGALRVVVELRPGAKATMGAPLLRPAGAQRLVLELTDPAGSRATPAAAVPASAAAVPTAASAPAPAPASNDAAPVVATATPTTLKAIKAAHAPAASGRLVVVAIDAGHGGQDPGAIGRAGTREKDVVLDIARALAARIDREPGMRAFLTRDGDHFIPLRDRIRRAREAGAMLFVSVHADSVRDPEVSGSSVYVLSDKGATDEQARMLADRENAADLAGGISIDDKDPMLASVLVDVSQSAQIGSSMAAAERVLRSLAGVNTVRKPQVQQAGFVVLKSPDIPSMLVETAFISSPDDERLLGMPERRAALAEAIFAGVQQYFVDHPPDGSRFALERRPERAVIATAPDAGVAPARTPGRL